jgi:Ca2+-binding RTX toxin-like protein
MATIPGSAADDFILGTADIDVLTGEAGNDVLAGLDSADAINGGDGNDIIIGGRGDDTLVGDAGDDRFVWNNGDGSDLMDGAGDIDTQQVNGADAAGDIFQVNVDIGANAIFQRTNLGLFTLTMNNVEHLEVHGLGGDDTFIVGDLSTSDVERVTFFGGEGNDGFSAAGSKTPVVVFGGGGGDGITTGLGNDYVDGGTGADTLVYGGGIDTFLIELADNVLTPGRTSAHATFGEGRLVLDFGSGNILDLHWQVGAFTAQDYYGAHLTNVVLV